MDAGLYSMNTQELVLKYGYTLTVETTGLIFPYDNKFSRVKFVPPVKTENGQMKYGQAKGSKARLYIPPVVREILSDSSKKLGFAEGEKKALKAVQEGLYTIGIGGLWSWMQDGKPIKDLDSIVFFGREVDFFPDSDVWSKPDLLQAVYAFCMELERRGGQVKITRLPNINGADKTGLDDYLLNHTVADLEKLEQIPLSHKGFKQTKKWYDKWLSRKDKTEAAQEKEKDQDYTAVHDKLVDICVNQDGQICFLIKDNTELVSDTKLHKEDGQGDSFPPPRDAIKWSIPRLEKVLEYYKTDSAQRLYDDLVYYLKSISELPSDDYYHLLAAWIFHTYLFDKFSYSPYLWFYAIPERGKSRTGHALMNVAYRGLTVESLRDPYIIRAAQNINASLFFDVMDLWKKAERTGTEDILLQRFERGAVVARVLYPDRGPHKDTVFFDIYGSTVIATNEKVSEILATRAIQIIMPESSRTFEDDVKPEDALPLRERLVAWRARHMNNELPATLKPCRGRLGDILKPLRQVVLMTAPGEEQRFLNLCTKIQNQRYEILADTLEAAIIQAITDLEHEIENCNLLSKTITEKINEDIPEKYQRAQRTITQACKRMGFKAPRSDGQTYIEINPELFFQLSARYLRNSADSAVNKNTKKQVHCTTNRNNYEYAESADSALNQTPCTGKCENDKSHLYNDQRQVFDDQKGMWVDP